jgi:hypothetical protein
MAGSNPVDSEVKTLLELLDQLDDASAVITTRLWKVVKPTSEELSEINEENGDDLSDLEIIKRTIAMRKDSA